MNSKSCKRRRKNQPVQYVKKLRSKVPRRRRPQISPILASLLNESDANGKNREVSALTTESSCSSKFTRAITSGRVPAGADKSKDRHTILKTEFEVRKDSATLIRSKEASLLNLERIQDQEFRRITRSYYRQKINEQLLELKGAGNDEVDVSESSCIEASSGAKFRASAERDSNTTNRTNRNLTEEVGGNDDSGSITRVDISHILKFSGEFTGDDSKSDANCKLIIEDSTDTKEEEDILITSRKKHQNVCSSVGNLPVKNIDRNGNGAPGGEFSGFSRNYVESNMTISNSELTIDQKPIRYGLDGNLTCSERHLYDDLSDYSSSHEMALSELHSDLFPESSELDLSDYSPSFWLESGSEFSEGSRGDSNPSVCFSLFHQYHQQFSKLSSRPETKGSSCVEEHYQDEFILLRFEHEEEEESYQKLRSRERRQVSLGDYAEESWHFKEFDDLLMQQRSLLVNWIIEQSYEKNLHKETMFLGVSLLDRFLCRGFFQNKRNLQLAGIACLTLATRIEENQPLNSVRQKTFSIENNLYSRCEVVAMEWLVQEVLDFQCLLPTTYNFLCFYLKAARADPEVEKRANHLAVIALLGHEQLCYWPSTLAAGVVILASLAAQRYASCQRVMETHLRTKNDDLPECIKSLEWLVNYAC